MASLAVFANGLCRLQMGWPFDGLQFLMDSVWPSERLRSLEKASMATTQSKNTQPGVSSTPQHEEACLCHKKHVVY